MGLPIITSEPRRSPVAFRLVHCRPDFRAVKASWRSKAFSGARAASAVCLLWLSIEAVANNARGGQSDSTDRAFTAEQTPEHEQWDRAEALAHALTLSLHGELDAVRSTAEAERLRQTTLLERERDRADALSRELTSLQAELDKLRIMGLDAARAADTEAEREPVLVQERGKADGLAREPSTISANLDVTRAAAESASTSETATIEQEQALKSERDKSEALARELAAAHAELLRMTEADKALEENRKQAIGNERDRADTVARELVSLRAELDNARTGTPKANDEELEQNKALLNQERDRSDTLANALAAARKEVDARSALLAAAQAEILDMARTDKALIADQKQVLANETDRTAALARELASAKGELEAGKRQIASLYALVRHTHGSRRSTTRR
jgi:hypothetical protein